MIKCKRHVVKGVGTFGVIIESIELPPKNFTYFEVSTSIIFGKKRVRVCHKIPHNDKMFAGINTLICNTSTVVPEDMARALLKAFACDIETCTESGERSYHFYFRLTPPPAPIMKKGKVGKKAKKTETTRPVLQRQLARTTWRVAQNAFAE